MGNKPKRSKVVPKGLEPFIVEFKALIKKHGIGTYAFIAKDPDLTDQAHAVVDGSTAWVMGRLELLKDEIKADYFLTSEPLEEDDDPEGATRG